MSSALDLIVMNGPREGDIVHLKPAEPLRLGRSLKGFQLIDPLVSLNHAEIQWQGDRYWIEDLGSATGTFVDDVRLTDKPVVLDAGSRVRMGETVLEVRPRPKSTLLRAVGALAAVFLLAVGYQAYRQSITIEYRPQMLWYQDVRQGGGGVSPVVEVPDAFVREAGVDHRGLKIDEVTDLDEDGVDELWLSWKEGRRLVTFDTEGDWVTLAEIPPECSEKARPLPEGLPAECYVDADRVRSELPAICRSAAVTGGFPDLDCAGLHLRYTGEGYDVVGLEGVVAWMPAIERVKEEDAKEDDPGRAVATDGPPEPYLFTLSKPATLAGFLSKRGIQEPIHYLVCEEAIPNVRPHVLTQRGRIVPLPIGCLGDVDIVGATRVSQFGTTTPRMIAFTGSGYRQLLDDIAVYLAGGPTELLMNRAQLVLHRTLSKTPKPRQGSIRVLFEGPERVLDPVAEEGPIAVQGRLQPSEFGRELPPEAYEILLPEKGRYDLVGCSELEVKFSNWHCVSAKGCDYRSTPFMQIRNVGCGEPSKPAVFAYRDTPYPYEDDHIVGRIKLDTYEGNGQLDVLRVRMAYRERDDAE